MYTAGTTPACGDSIGIANSSKLVVRFFVLFLEMGIYYSDETNLTPCTYTVLWN